jgi:hypothetical protein
MLTSAAYVQFPIPPGAAYTRVAGVVFVRGQAREVMGLKQNLDLSVIKESWSWRFYFRHGLDLRLVRAKFCGCVCIVLIG